MLARLLAVCAGLAALVGAAPAAGQAVICCNVTIDVKGKWVGSSRDCSGALKEAPPEVLADACKALAGCKDAEAYCPACDQAQIDRLLRQQKQQREIADLSRKRGTEAESKRYKARDELWGKGEGLKFEGGSIADFGKAALDSILLASGGGGGVGKTYSEVMKQYKTVKGWTDTGWNLGSDPLELENWTGLGKDLLKMEADDIFRRRSSEAWRASIEHFRKTGNRYGAVNVYNNKWRGYGALKDFKNTWDQKVKKANDFTGALDKLSKLYEKTDKLANDLQDWIDAYRDQNMNERDRAKAEEEVERIHKELIRLRAACGIKPGTGLPSSSLDSPAAGGTALPEGVGLAVAAAPQQGPGSSGAEATLKHAEQALPGLRAFQKRLRALDRSLGKQLVAPLSPWFAGIAGEAEPRELLLELVKASRASFAQMEITLEQLSRAGTETWKSLEAIPPDRGR